MCEKHFKCQRLFHIPTVISCTGWFVFYSNTSIGFGIANFSRWTWFERSSTGCPFRCFLCCLYRRSDFPTTICGRVAFLSRRTWFKLGFRFRFWFLHCFVCWFWFCFRFYHRLQFGFGFVFIGFLNIGFDNGVLLRQFPTFLGWSRLTGIIQVVFL